MISSRELLLSLVVPLLVFSVPCYCTSSSSSSNSRELLKENVHHYNAPEWEVISPLDNPCVTERGFFGRQAKFDQVVRYQYELTVIDGEYLDDAFGGRQAGSSSGQTPEGLHGLFSSVEQAIADNLLESQVFESICAGGVARGPYLKGVADGGGYGAGYGGGGGRRLLRDDDNNQNRRMRAVGITSNPDDQILEGLNCKAFVNETDGPCMVVDGEFVIYLDIYEDLDDSLAEILEDMMNVRHELDNVHPYVQKVRYVSLSAESISGSIEAEGEGDAQPGGNNATLSSGFYAVLAAGAFIMVGTAIFYRRRRNATAELDGDTTTLAQNTAHLPQSQETQ